MEADSVCPRWWDSVCWGPTDASISDPPRTGEERLNQLARYQLRGTGFALTLAEDPEDRGVQPMLPGLTRVGQGTHKATPMGNALWVEVQSLGTQSGSRALGTVH